jgi:hypothetical protein
MDCANLNASGERMSDIPKVLAAVCISGFVAAPVMYLRDGVASPKQTNIIMIADDVPSESEVRSAVLRQAKKENDEDLAALKINCNKIFRSVVAFLSRSVYTQRKQCFSSHLEIPGGIMVHHFHPTPVLSIIKILVLNSR